MKLRIEDLSADRGGTRWILRGVKVQRSHRTELNILMECDRTARLAVHHGWDAWKNLDKLILPIKRDCNGILSAEWNAELNTVEVEIYLSAPTDVRVYWREEELVKHNSYPEDWVPTPKQELAMLQEI